MGEEISQAARNPQPSGGGEQSISNIADEDLRLSDFGVNAGQYLDTIDTIRAYEDPYADTGTSADFEAKHEEWDQGMALDALSGLYNGRITFQLSSMLKKLSTVMLLTKILMSLEILIPDILLVD